MATRVIKWTQNDLGLWKSDDGQWGIFLETNGRYRLQAKYGPQPWEWNFVGTFPSFEDASQTANGMPRGSF